MSTPINAAGQEDANLIEIHGGRVDLEEMTAEQMKVMVRYMYGEMQRMKRMASN